MVVQGMGEKRVQGDPDWPHKFEPTWADPGLEKKEKPCVPLSGLHVCSKRAP